MNKSILTSLLLICGVCVCAPAAIAAQEDLQRQLTGQYQDKVLALRHPYQSRFQEYAEDGASLKRSGEGPWTAYGRMLLKNDPFNEEGSWTVYGRMLVKDVSVNVERLTLEGKRVLYVFDKNGKMAELPDDRKNPAEGIKITVRLQKPLSSLDEATTILGHVFALTPEDVVNSAPACWQVYLAKQLGVQSEKALASQDGGSGETVFSLSDFKDKEHTTPPRISYQPMPEFADAASGYRVDGVVGINAVVDITGKVTNIEIVHPIGLGWDERAMSTVRNWRFKPAKRDGQPVAVRMYMEVDFHLSY